MAQIEPMDIDAIESDFDNKENTFHHSNVLSRTPCTEKGYEELDVSELNMKLRYSITPASSPMSKSLTGPSLDNRHFNSSEDYLNNALGTENSSLTRSLNSTFNKNETNTKSKVLPLQTLSAEPFVDSNRNSSMRRLIDSDNNVTISLGTNEDENLSLPSTSSSVANTPEATTPTKEIPKPEGSPILRGLKSVLSMFRPSQSPISPAENTTKQDILSPEESQLSHKSEVPIVLASTPVAANKQKEAISSRRSSPLKESVVFNDDLERELQWKDETTIIFKGEKIPVSKLFFQNSVLPEAIKNTGTEHMNTTLEYMDISCNESMVDRTMTDIEHTVPVKIEGAVAVESDNEFLDCETTFTKNESCLSDYTETEMENKNKGIENLTVELSEVIEVKEKNELDTKNIMSASENIQSACVDYKLSTDRLSVSDIAVRPLVENASKIIEATMGMFITESHNDINNENKFHTQNASLEDSLAPINEKQPQAPDIRRAIDDEIVDNDGKILEIATIDTSVVVENKINDFSLNKNPEAKLSSDEVMSAIFEDQISSVINLPDVCTVNSLNQIEDVLCEKSSTEITGNDESTLLNKDMEVCIKNVIHSSAAYNVANAMESSDSTISVTKNEVQHILQNLESNQVLQHEMNPDLLSSHNAISAIVDSEISPKNENGLNELTSIVHRSSRLEEDLSVTKTNKIEYDVIKNVEDTNFGAKLEWNPEANIPKVDLECKQEVNVSFDSTNNHDIENTSSNLKSDAIHNLECHVDVVKTLHIEFNNALSEHGLEVPELNIGNDMATTNSPSEIPLPDEDDIEQPLTLTNVNNLIHTEADIAQDVTFEIHDDNLVMHVEKADDVATENKNAQGSLTQNVTEEIIIATCKSDICPQNIVVDNNINIVINNNIENAEHISVSDHNEFNEIQTCDTNKIRFTKYEISEDKTSDMHTENLAHSEIDSTITMSNLQIPTKNNQLTNYTLNASKSAETVDVNINFQQVQSCENACEKINIKIDNEAVSGNLRGSEATCILEEEVCTAGLLDIVKPESASSTNNFEDINGSKIDENIQQDKEVQEIDEEIITSANNSPYVSVTELALDTELTKDPLQNKDNPFATNRKIAMSPPTSPIIMSKGYNFDFDDIDDPFATKTKIRMSPTPESSNQPSIMLTEPVKKVEVPKKVNNRRKSQPERKKPAQKKNINSTFNNKLPIKGNISEKNDEKQKTITSMDVLDNISSSIQITTDIKPESAIDYPEVVQNENVTIDTCETETSVGLTSTIQKEDIHETQEEVKCLDQTIVFDQKSTSSSEQYFSLGTSSGESVNLMNRSKNVFNLPEIDDVNFNPFATKSKMRMSPPPPLSGHNSTNTKEVEQCVINTTSGGVVESDRTFDKIPAKDSSPNISNATCSSNNTNEENTTIKEVHTEDEDTIEGPFLDDEDDKVSDIADVEVANDMMNFDDIPQDKDENLGNGELFIDADAFEFLLNQNKSATVLDSGKESLFLKFDPLFAKRVSSDGVLAALSQVQKRQSTPKKLIKPTQKDFTHIEKPSTSIEKDNSLPVEKPCTSTEKDNNVPVEEYNEDLSSTITKPMMVVNPAMSSLVSPRRSATPPKINRRSLTFTSPAMAVIDRLLSLSGNTSHLDHNTSIPHSSREHNEADLAIMQLRELLAEKEIHVHNLRSESKELKDRLADLEVQVRNLETESSERLAKINDLNERLSEKTKINKSMAIVVEEYERTIASLIAETEQDKKRNAEERMSLIKERDEQTAHLTSMEVSFNDLHSKYEKSKQIILTCKANEDTYKRSIKEFEDNFSKMQNNYELLKQHATSKLNHANQELEKMNRAHEAEVLKLNAMIKRKDLHITSLEETLAQKTKANDELTAICDELINKVG